MDEQTMFTLLVDLHRNGHRQGPGGTEETNRALELTRLDRAGGFQVADIGCGTGASTLVLAAALPNARIVAADLFPEFLSILAGRANAAGCADRIETMEASMDALPFADESLDLIWSEGAIYNIGFRNGLAAWRPFLKTGGVLAVSEITWLHPDPPEEIRQYWNAQYPEMATAAEKIAIIERAGYGLLGYFWLPSTCWLENYYLPVEARLPAFLERHAGEADAAQIIEMERQEAALYRRYHYCYSYGFYVACKQGDSKPR